MNKNSIEYTCTCKFVPYPLPVMVLINLMTKIPQPTFTRQDIHIMLLALRASSDVPFHCKKNYEKILNHLDYYVDYAIENRFFEESVPVQIVPQKNVSRIKIFNQRK